MEVNPYESPRELAAPLSQPKQPVVVIAGLRISGIQGAACCFAGLFLVMVCDWLNQGGSVRPYPWLDYAAIGIAVLTIGVGLASASAIIFGDAISRA